MNCSGDLYVSSELKARIQLINLPCDEKSSFLVVNP